MTSRIHTTMPQISPPVFLLILLVLGAATLLLWRHGQRAAIVKYQRVPSLGDNKIRRRRQSSAERGQAVIEPVSQDFDWKNVEPLKLRPFKPIYHVTMAIRSSPPSDLIRIDTNYVSRIQGRQRIMAENSSHVLGCLKPAGVEPVRELYAYLLGDYLPARYPGLFSVRDEAGDNNEKKSKKKTFYNHITGTTLPVFPYPSAVVGEGDQDQDPLTLLRNLGQTVEDDLFLLVQDPDDKGKDGGGGEGGGSRHSSEGGGGDDEKKKGGGEHRLAAVLCCHPSGFDPSEKLGKTLAGIHGPVPSYDKIGPSMERFFSRLEVGKSSYRVNWTITTQPTLFDLSDNHVKVDDEKDIDMAGAVEKDQDIDIDSTYVRMELQTLTRLPLTNSILFSFKTYLYPIRELKEEGLGLEIADAIEGLGKGNAPGMVTYKGAVRWGKGACEFLRS